MLAAGMLFTAPSNLKSTFSILDMEYLVTLQAVLAAERLYTNWSVTAVYAGGTCARCGDALAKGK